MEVVAKPEAAPAKEIPEVIMMGMIHGAHRTSARYGITQVRAMIAAIAPDIVLCEIPPDRLSAALEEYRRYGTVEEPRVRRFPEYVDALFPLWRDRAFSIVPCAAWTAEMAERRSETLATLRSQQDERWQLAQAAMDNAEREINRRGWRDDPRGIHSDAYDEIVRLGMRPYDEALSPVLEDGGWTSINEAHYALIREALDTQRGSGRRILIMFGAWHKYWFLDQLRQRDDVRIRSPLEFMTETPPDG